MGNGAVDDGGAVGLSLALVSQCLVDRIKKEVGVGRVELAKLAVGIGEGAVDGKNGAVEVDYPLAGGILGNFKKVGIDFVLEIQNGTEGVVVGKGRGGRVAGKVILVLVVEVVITPMIGGVNGFIDLLESDQGLGVIDLKKTDGAKTV